MRSGPFIDLSLGVSVAAGNFHGSFEHPHCLAETSAYGTGFDQGPTAKTESWVPKALPIPRASPTAVPTVASVEPIQVSKTCKPETPSDPDFDGALYSAKAFGIATTLVTVGALV